LEGIQGLAFFSHGTCAKWTWNMEQKSLQTQTSSKARNIAVLLA